MIARTLCRKDWTYVTMVNSKAGQVETVAAVSVPLFILLRCQFTLCNLRLSLFQKARKSWCHGSMMGSCSARTRQSTRQTRRAAGMK